MSINVISSIAEIIGLSYGGDPVLTSIVIATFNKLDYTQQCIQSIRDYTEAGTYEIIVVDNHSTDETVEWLQQQTDIKTVFNKENMGFPKACNQGIEVAMGNSILLLNNDTIVTAGWLDNLTGCLYSCDEIGAVGAITNNCSYAQSIPVNYTTIAEMQEFAKEHNRPNQSAWEERLKLIGFCMLIKKSVVNQIGLLDERFTPGNYEDDDYSLRIRLAGYKLLFCKDTFIHHYGSVSFREAPPEYIQLMSNNKQKFMDKWGIDPEDAFKFRSDFVPTFHEETPLRVLEIGCGFGGNLLQIRHRYPHAVLFGTERNENIARVAALVADIYQFEIEGLDLFSEGSLDIILISESISRWEQPDEILGRLRSLLSDKGKLVAFVPNALYYKQLQSFGRGESGLRELDGLTLKETQSIFEQASFQQLHVTGLVSPISESDSLFVRKLADAWGTGETTLYEIKEFYVQSEAVFADLLIPSESDLKTVINELLTETDIESNIRRLAAIEADQVFETIEAAGAEQKEQLLNFLAVQLLEAGQDKLALLYLQQAFEWDSGNPQTLFNLGLTMYTQCQLELALEWFSFIPEKTEQVQKWMAEIRSELRKQAVQEHHLTFLLRRIEFDIEYNESLSSVIEGLREGSLTIEQIVDETRRHSIHKSDLLTAIARECYEHRLLELVFPLFEGALSLEPKNERMLLQLGLILVELGDRETAHEYLSKIEHPNPEVEEILEVLGGVKV
jgi:O-antigen biosynthesis protein